MNFGHREGSRIVSSLDFGSERIRWTSVIEKVVGLHHPWTLSPKEIQRILSLCTMVCRLLLMMMMMFLIKRSDVADDDDVLWSKDQKLPMMMTFSDWNIRVWWWCCCWSKGSKCWRCCWSKGQSIEDVAEVVADWKVKILKMLLIERSKNWRCC